jgi:hypothetical protein
MLSNWNRSSNRKGDAILLQNYAKDRLWEILYYERVNCRKKKLWISFARFFRGLWQLLKIASYIETSSQLILLSRRLSRLKSSILDSAKLLEPKRWCGLSMSDHRLTWRLKPICEHCIVKKAIAGHLEWYFFKCCTEGHLTKDNLLKITSNSWNITPAIFARWMGKRTRMYEIFLKNR